MKRSQGLKEKIHYTYQMKKQLLMQKTCAIAEANEADKYLELQEQYVYMFAIYLFSIIYNFF